MSKEACFEIRLPQTLRAEMDDMAKMLGISVTELSRAAISKFCAELKDTEMKVQLEKVNEFKKKLHIQ